MPRDGPQRCVPHLEIVDAVGGREKLPGRVRCSHPASFRAAGELAGCDHKTVKHGLANATGWHEVKVISQRLGHASVGFTIDTYAHVLPAADSETAFTLARLILEESA